MAPWTPIVAAGHTAIVLVRHGRTAFNHEGRFLGRTDLPLDDVGREQAERLRPWRGAFDRVVSSPLARARGTAAVLSDAPEIVDAFAELDQGDLEGLLVAEAMAQHPSFFAAWAEDPGPARVPGGGRLDELRDGALEALEQVARGPGQTMAVVSHQLVLASVLATLDRAPLTRWRAYALPNVGAAMVAYDGDSMRIVEKTLESA